MMPPTKAAPETHALVNKGGIFLRDARRHALQPTSAKDNTMAKIFHHRVVWSNRDAPKMGTPIHAGWSAIANPMMTPMAIVMLGRLIETVTSSHRAPVDALILHHNVPFSQIVSQLTAERCRKAA